MKKIIGLAVGVAAVIGLVASGTWALFTDTEGPQTVTLSAGTVDIEVDGLNPWTGQVTLDDLKPCQPIYIDYDIKNVGKDPVVVYKHLLAKWPSDPEDPENNIPITSTGIQVYPPDNQLYSSEPEAEAAGYIDENEPGTDLNNIDTLIGYDLSSVITKGKGGVDPTLGGGEGWHQIEYYDNEFISKLFCKPVILGSIMPGGTMHVVQSYHLGKDVGNIYQGDTVVFYVQFEAVQIEGTQVLMENKVKAFDGSYVGFGDGTYGTLGYNAHGPTFDYTFEAFGLTPSTDYKLIYYADPWPGNNPGPSKLIGKFTTDGSGDIALTAGSVDLNMDLPGPSDDNAPQGAKIWLVPQGNFSGVNPGDSGQVTTYDEANFLFETHTIVYDDTDV